MFLPVLWCRSQMIQSWAGDCCDSRSDASRPHFDGAPFGNLWSDVAKLAQKLWSSHATSRRLKQRVLGKVGRRDSHAAARVMGLDIVRIPQSLRVAM